MSYQQSAMHTLKKYKLIGNIKFTNEKTNILERRAVIIHVASYVNQ